MSYRAIALGARYTFDARHRLIRSPEEEFALSLDVDRAAEEPAL